MCMLINRSGVGAYRSVCKISLCILADRPGPHVYFQSMPGAFERDRSLGPDGPNPFEETMTRMTVVCCLCISAMRLMF